MILLKSRRVLVPTDFTPQSEQALVEALDMLESPADVTALHVALPLDSYALTDPAIIWESMTDDDRRKKLSESFRGWKPDAGEADPRRADVDFQVAFGHAAEEITRYADEHEIELIVMPSHGRQGLERIFVGSVAERVVRTAHCPVLVLRH